jgi:hypothetical protein
MTPVPLVQDGANDSTENRCDEANQSAIQLSLLLRKGGNAVRLFPSTTMRAIIYACFIERLSGNGRWLPVDPAGQLAGVLHRSPLKAGEHRIGKEIQSFAVQ